MTRALLDNRRASPKKAFVLRIASGVDSEGRKRVGRGGGVSVLNNRAFSKMEERKIGGSI